MSVFECQCTLIDANDDLTLISCVCIGESRWHTHTHIIFSQLTSQTYSTLMPLTSQHTRHHTTVHNTTVAPQYNTSHTTKTLTVHTMCLMHLTTVNLTYVCACEVECKGCRVSFGIGMCMSGVYTHFYMLSRVVRCSSGSREGGCTRVHWICIAP